MNSVCRAIRRTVGSFSLYFERWTACLSDLLDRISTLDVPFTSEAVDDLQSWRSNASPATCGHQRRQRASQRRGSIFAISIAVTVVVAALLTLAGCSHHDDKSAPPATVTSTTSPTPHATTEAPASAPTGSAPSVMVEAARRFVAAYLGGPANESSAAFAARLKPYVTSNFERRLQTTQRGLQDPNAHGVDVLRYSGSNNTVTIIADRWPLDPTTGAAVGTSATYTVTVTLVSQPDGMWRADQVEAVPTS